MKKTILAIFVAAITMPVMAQLNDINEKKFSVGVRTGVTIGGLTGVADMLNYDPSGIAPVNPYDSKAGAGISLGVVFNTRINDWFYIQPGLEYAMLSSKAKMELPAKELDGTGLSEDKYSTVVRGHYLRIPILASFRINFDKCQLQVNTGPYLAVALAARQIDSNAFTYAADQGAYSGMTFKEKTITDPLATQYNMVYDNTGNLTEIDEYSEYNRFDVGWDIGIALNYKNIVFGAKYNVGFVNMLNEEMFNIVNASEPGDVKFDKTMRNSSFSLSIGYDF